MPRHEVTGRASRPSSSGAVKCIAYGCSRLTQRSAGKGLSEAYCKPHIEFHRRHGSHWKRSYKVAEINPYRKAARQWIRKHRKAPIVSRIISALDTMIANSGRSKSAYNLRGLAPDERSRQVMARLREAGIPGERLLEITLTIKAAMTDIGPRAGREFMQVQIAKMAHRLNSGTTRSPFGFPVPPKYPRPEGRFMRVLGHRIEDLAGIAATPEAVHEVVKLAGAFK